MNIEADDTNFADIENIESIEGIIKIGNSGAPSISDLSPNSDWKTFPQSSYNGCYGLPYQDHNYGAPPPPTPPPSPGNPIIATKKKSFQVALKSVKPLKTTPEKKTKAPQKRQTVNRRKSGSSNTKSVEVKVDLEEQAVPVDVTPEPVESDGGATGDYSDSVTRCICNFTHDDGYMICCDQCQVWQHIDCMGIDRANIPDEYSCEQCMPRRVYKARARLIQKNKRDEILRSSSEDENANAKKSNQNKSVKKTRTKFGTQRNKKINQRPTPVKNGTFLSTNKKPNVTNTSNSQFHSKRQSKRNGDSQALVSVDGEPEESPWTATYDSAKANEYSADIQESLKSYRPNSAYQLESVLSELDSPRCHLHLLANGRRALEVDSHIRCDQALIEFKGKVMLQQQFEQENNFIKRAQPFVLFYNNWDDLKICVDATSYGNEARFVRRSCIPNSEVRHVIENGRIHLVLFSIEEIQASCEVTIPFDFDYRSCEYSVECACSKVQCPVRKAGRKYKRSASYFGGERNKQKNIPTKVTVKPANTPAKQRQVHEELKVHIPVNNHSEQRLDSKLQVASKSAGDQIKSPNTEKAAVEETRRLSREDRKIEAYMKAFEKMEKREERRKEALQRINEKKESPSASKETAPSEFVKQQSPIQPSPVKLNNNKSISTVQSTSVNKIPARRRRNKSGPAVRRRTASNSAVSASVSLPASEAEQDDSSSNGHPQDSLPTSRVPAPAEVGSTHTGTVTSSSAATGFRFPKTKKQIVHEWYQEKIHEKCIEKPLTVSVPVEDNIDFVKTNSSPGSTFANLRRNSISSNVQSAHAAAIYHTPITAARKLDSSMGSAKKRWLKQAMEEDNSNQSVATPLTSPSNEHQVHMSLSSTVHMDTPMSPVSNSTCPMINAAAATTDFVTPFKKRRLARESLSLDSHPTSPTLESTPLTCTVVSPVNEELKVKVIPCDAESALDKKNIVTPSDTSENVTPSLMSTTSSTEPSISEENIVPEPVQACSPVYSPDSVQEGIPTTIMDVTESDKSGALKSHKLKQQSKDDISFEGVITSQPATVMLSPREPKTLGDLMQQATSPQYADMALSKIANIDKLTQHRHCIDLTQAMYTEPCSLKENCKTLEHRKAMTVSLAHVSDMSTINSYDYKLSNELKRSVSLMESSPRYHEWNGAGDCGVDLVQNSVKQEPGGDKEYALNTPQKKKVSLLEYRKRMQVQAPRSDSSTSLSAPTTPLSSNDTIAATAVQQQAPISLPSLPLFKDVHDNGKSVKGNQNMPQRPAISLDERLKLEFGFDAQMQNNEENSDDGSCDTPPPPPPPPPPKSPPKSALDNSSSKLLKVHENLSGNVVMIGDLKPKSRENGFSETYSDLKCDAEANEVHLEGIKTSVLDSPQQSNNELSPIRGKKTPSFPLKQGSLGAVMLGQPIAVSPITNCTNSRDISGSRQIGPLNLPKKYR